MQYMRRLLSTGLFVALTLSLPVSVGAAATKAPVTTTTAVPGGPFSNTALSHYLDSRQGTVTMAVLNLNSSQGYVYNDHVRQLTASMVKIDILAALLAKCQEEKRWLSPAEQYQATLMVEQSNNDAAQLLWNDVGGYGLSPKVTGTGGTLVVRAFNAKIGFSDTYTDWGWGDMDTTPADYLKLLKVIALPNKILSDASRKYEMALMEHVVSYQRFGIPNGIPKSVQVGVKNGWYPEGGTGWQINSAAYVFSNSAKYLAVIMTGHNPDESYGMDTVNNAGALLWRFMGHGA